MVVSLNKFNQVEGIELVKMPIPGVEEPMLCAEDPVPGMEEPAIDVIKPSPDPVGLNVHATPAALPTVKVEITQVHTVPPKLLRGHY